MQVNFVYSFVEVPYKEGILIQELAGSARLHVPLPKAGILLFDKRYLLVGRKLNLLLGRLLFEPKPPLVSAADTLLV